MKCKDCTVYYCQYRTTDAEKDCYYEQWTAKEFDWQSFRAEAAIKMLIVTSEWHLTKGDAKVSIPKETACKLAIQYADELVKQLKEKEEK